MEIKAAFGAVKAFCSKHATAISAVTSIVCYAGAIVSAISETRTFDARIEELKIANDGKPIEKKAIVKTAIRSYWLTAMIYGVATTANIMGLRAANRRAVGLAMELSQLSAAHKVTEKAFRNYKEAVKKTVSEKQQQKVRDEEAKEVVKDVTPTAIESAERIPTASQNVQLCMERWTRRLFYADPLELKEGFVRFIERYNDDEIVSLNDLFNEWGLSTYDSNIGEAGIGARLGWKRDVIGSGLRLDIRATVSSDETKSIYVIGTNIFPEYDFDAFNGY